MEPKRDAKIGDTTAWTFHIAHRGYSTLFVKSRESQLAIIDQNWTVKRDAVARFGTPIAIEDPNR